MFSRQGSSSNGTLFQSLVTVSDPNSPASEAYRTLRTNLLYSAVDEPPQAVVLTSPGPGEGKSTTCANLGVVLAQTGWSCLILDCDLRKPTMHKVFGLRNVWGVADVVVGQRTLEAVWQEPIKGLKVVTSGSIPPNPAELLESGRFTELLGQARQQFKYVLVDAPPVELVSDAAILATQVDGVLLVLDAHNTRKTSVRKSIRSLNTVGANVLGTVMNNVKASKGSGYYNYGRYT